MHNLVVSRKYDAECEWTKYNNYDEQLRAETQCIRTSNILLVMVSHQRPVNVNYGCGLILLEKSKFPAFAHHHHHHHHHHAVGRDATKTASIT